LVSEEEAAEFCRENDIEKALELFPVEEG